MRTREKAREAERRYGEANREQIAERARQRYAANPEQGRQRARQYREANLEKRREAERRYREANREKLREQKRQQHSKLRAAVFDHYGQSCACCGTADDLAIDHINGDGGQHLAAARLGRGGQRLYRWLARNGFPEGFQALCMPCNRSKSTGARCRLNHAPAPARRNDHV